MNLTKQIRTHFYRTPLLKGLFDNYAEENKLKVVDKIQLAELEKKAEVGSVLQKELPSVVETKVQEEISKRETMLKNNAMRFRVPMNYNSNSNPDRKYQSDIPFSYMRRMAVLYPIARACINRRVRQITQLDWEITTVDEIEDEKGFEKQIAMVNAFFKQPMGHKTKSRELLTVIVNDILTLDAVCFEMQKRRNGDFMHLIPVDPSTIVLRVTETGGTPEPPDIAYAQYIAGKKIAEFTTNEMIYEMMNPKSDTPYGLSPLESLILQCEAALRGTMYNLGYFRENNIPEGFLTLPEEVANSQAAIEEWQTWFDSILAGDSRTIHRLKILPGGSEYVPTKKPEDMAFERFELWLLQQTCAVFDVQPNDIGITLNVNKATGQVQQELGKERGLVPLANFIKEIFDDLIQVEMGLPDIQFVWSNVNPADRKEEVDIAEKEIKMGALSVDEYRQEQGREPIGLEHFVMGGTPVMVKDIVSGEYQRREDMRAGFDENGKPIESKQDGKLDPAKNKEKMEQADLKKWRTCIYNDLEKGKELRTRFPSEYISPETHKVIEEALPVVKTKEQAKLLFDQFLDTEVKASMTLLKMASQMRRIEDATFAED